MEPYEVHRTLGMQLDEIANAFSKLRVNTARTFNRIAAGFSGPCQSVARRCEHFRVDAAAHPSGAGRVNLKHR